MVFTVFFGFVYAFAGTGVAQLLFRHQADGSITANGSTLIGQNWSATKCPGHPDGSCVFQGRPDALGPYAGGDGDNPLVYNGESGESAATNLGPRSKVLLANTQALVAYWHTRGVDPTPDLVTTSGSGLDPDITPRTPSSRYPWSRPPPASRRRPCAASSPRRPTARYWASWGAATSTSCS